MQHLFRPGVDGDSHSYHAHSSLIMWDMVQQPSCCSSALMNEESVGKFQLLVHNHGHCKLHCSCLSNSHSPQTKEQLLNSQVDKETLMLCLHMEKYMHIVISVLLPTRINS